MTDGVPTPLPSVASLARSSRLLVSALLAPAVAAGTRGGWRSSPPRRLLLRRRRRRRTGCSPSRGACAPTACRASPTPSASSEGTMKLTIDEAATEPGGLERRRPPAPDERWAPVTGNGPAAAYPARGRAVVRAVHAQPWCALLPRSDRAGSSVGRDGPGPGHRCALTGSSTGRARRACWLCMAGLRSRRSQRRSTMPADDPARVAEDVLDAPTACQVDLPGTPVPSNPGT